MPNTLYIMVIVDCEHSPFHSGKLHSSVIASDNLSHTKETLVAYIDKVLEDLPPTIKAVSI